jgi:hypothetical protein
VPEFTQGTGDDPLNDLLRVAEPAKVCTSVVNTPHGAVGILTIRTPTTTITVTAAKEDALAWAAQITRWAQVIPGAGLVSPGPHIALPTPGQQNGGRKNG